MAAVLVTTTLPAVNLFVLLVGVVKIPRCCCGCVCSKQRVPMGGRKAPLVRGGTCCNSAASAIVASIQCYTSAIRCSGLLHQFSVTLLPLGVVVYCINSVLHVCH